MASWITELFQQPALIGQYVVPAAAIFVLMLVLVAVSLIIVIGLPPDYFHATRVRSAQSANRGLFFGVGIVLKNVLGAVLIIIGVTLAVPGVPGPGLLTVVAGILLMDFPGKRILLCKILGRPSLLRAINHLRIRFSRPPLVIG